MYKSLKSWSTQKVKVLSAGETNAAGEAAIGKIVEIPCSRQDKFNVIVDRTGIEVISKIVLYVDSKYEILPTDIIEIDEETHNILSICKFYDGPNGIQEIYI